MPGQTGCQHQQISIMTVKICNPKGPKLSLRMDEDCGAVEGTCKNLAGVSGGGIHTGA